MTTLPSECVGESFTNDFAWQILEDLTDIGNRMAGQQGEEKGAEVMEDAFESIGARGVTTTEFDISGWWRDSAALTLDVDDKTRTFDEPYQVLGLPGSPETEETAEIVSVGDGLPEDFTADTLAGKIVVAGSQNPASYGRRINRIEKYARAAHAGAVGFIYYNDMTGGAIPPSGAIGFGHSFPGPIPAVGVSNEVGAYIHRHLADNRMTGTVQVSCRNEPAVCRNVEGVIGPDTEQELIVTAHVDSHDVGDGARDNGTGCAIVAEIGRVLQMVSDDLEYQVRLITFGGEETGLLGSTHWADTHDLSTVVGQINLDGIGYSRNLGVKGLGLNSHFSALEATNTGPILTLERVSPFNDTWPFVTAGVPSVSCRSTTGNEDQVARYGNLEWGHTHADTLDKLDPRDIRDLAILITQGTYSCATATQSDRITQDEVTALAAGDLEEYLEFDDRWPY